VSSHGTPWPRGVSSANSTCWDLPRAPIAASLARRQLAGGLPDLPSDQVEIAQVLVSELVTNALKHGQGAITLGITRDDRTLTVAVADQGTQRPDPQERDVTAPHGRGLQILQSLAAGWGTDPLPDGSAGKVVWFTLCTAPDGDDRRVVAHD
jgi:anti-sigma regulatory factor (Ser/Thr protein kinase)